MLELWLTGPCSTSSSQLFGVKGQSLTRVKMYDWVASVDSMASDFAARVKARKQGISNSAQHRCAEMSRWMATAAERAQPHSGDQFRRPFAA
jgi:hypothetical protein